MGRYLLRRLIALIPLVFLIALIAFTLVRLTPGDPASVVAGPDATFEEVERIRRSMGLDEPIWFQFVAWIERVFLHGDLGDSLVQEQPVLEMILQRAQPTLLLAAVGAFFSMLIGIPFGVIAAVKHNSWIDRFLMSAAIVGLSIPNFWLGVLLVLGLAIYWPLFPPAGFEPIQEGGLSALRYLILPGIAIGASNAAFLARMVRSSMLDVLNQDYVRTARAKGLRQRAVIYRHALRNAMIAPLTIVGLLVANLASGTIIIEIVFNVPGVGRLLINSVGRRDYPIMQGIILITALIYILANLIVDLLYSVLDPRVKYE
ncbi:MAG: ABC transporter permease [Chloroflexota bacterium]|nr:ABC transporter permease [Chloroflexota bacterium]